MMKFSSSTGKNVVRLVQSAQVFSPTAFLLGGNIVKWQQQQQQQQSLVVLMRTSTTSMTSGSSSRRRLLVLSSSTGSSSAKEKVATLLCTTAAKKARDETDRSFSSSTSSSVESSFSAQPNKKKSRDEIMAMIRALFDESNVKKQIRQWQVWKASSIITKFDHANLDSFPINLTMLEQQCTSLTLEILKLLADNDNSKVVDDDDMVKDDFKVVDLLDDSVISLQERVCRHEAAHFCCGYWCGLHVVGYTVQDNMAQVKFACIPEPEQLSGFSTVVQPQRPREPLAKNGRHVVQQRQQRDNNIRERGLSQKQVASHAVTAMAGIVGEVLQCKKNAAAAAAVAQWGTCSGRNDLLQLEQVFQDSAKPISTDKQREFIQWGTLIAAELLQNNSKTYEMVVQAFTRQASIEECIAILES